MVKAYLRYTLSAKFGVICSNHGNAVLDHEAKLAISPSINSVNVWDLKKGTLSSVWTDNDVKAQVTCIKRSPKPFLYAVGYSDGSIRIWDAKLRSCSITFHGHRNEVTSLCFDSTGDRLASGSKDTDLIVWDTLEQVGLYRLKGHKDMITSIHFISPNLYREFGSAEVLPDYLISTSKDTLLKLWDLTTQHCIETHVAHKSEVWDMDIFQQTTLESGQSKKEVRLITGGGEGENLIKVWKLDVELLKNYSSQMDIDSEDEPRRVISYYGALQRQNKDRVVTLKVHPSGRLLGCQGASKCVEIFRIRDTEELTRKLNRKKKRQREKQAKGKEAEANSIEIDVNDEIIPIWIIRTSAKIRSFDFDPFTKLKKGASPVMILCSLVNNTLETYSVPLSNSKSKSENDNTASKLFSIDSQGHRSDVRTLCLSSDNELLSSASSDSLKLWNVKTQSCIRTMDCGYALCSLFPPGDKHVIVGTKAGDIEIFHIPSSTLIEQIKGAHDGPIYSMAMTFDKKGIATGSSDKSVKFWDFEFKEMDSESFTQRQLTLVHSRTLQINDDVLCVRFSPDQRLVAVSLLDSTVKIFYLDSLKFFLSLYGHKLPVISMDISSDSQLIVTCSADKNVKIWGLDFGDCHKSIFAHDEAITDIKFTWGTHYFWTISKDKSIKCWDGDKFENIMKLDGHLDEIQALALGHYGQFLVTASKDKSLRIWEKTDEQLFLSEEREREIEEMNEAKMIESLDQSTHPKNEATEEVDAAGKQTMQTLKAGERIIEAVEVYESEAPIQSAYKQALAEGKKVAPPPENIFLSVAGNPTPEKYVLMAIEKIRASDLEEALLILPFSKVISLFHCIDHWAKNGWKKVLTCRVLFCLLRIHQQQIVSSSSLKSLMVSIQNHVQQQLRSEQNMIGFNIAASQFIRRQMEENQVSEMSVEDIDKMEQDLESVKKRKFLSL